MSRTPANMNDASASPRSRASQAPRGFFWQGVFILLPVAILAIVGFYSLRQDRLLAEAEARQTAQRHADEVSRRIWERLRSTTRLADPGALTFRLDAQGRLVFPPPAPALPVPQPLDAATLRPDQAALWRLAMTEIADGRTSDESLRAAETLANTTPPLPKPLAAALQFRLGLRQLAAGQTNDALSSLRTVVDQYPDAVTEAGLPLAPLAELKLFEAMTGSAPHRRPAAALLDAFGSNLVHRPTVLTPILLEQAIHLTPAPAANGSFARHPIRHWLDEWQWHEARRAMAAEFLRSTTPLHTAAEASSHRPPPLLSWLATPQVFHLEDWSPGPPAARHSRPGPATLNRIDVSMTVYSGEDVTSFTNPPPPVAVLRTFLTTNHVLATRLPADNGGSWIVCQGLGPVSDGSIQPQGGLWADVQSSFPLAPPWLGITIDLAGKTIVSDHQLRTLVLRPSGKGGGQSWVASVPLATPEILATSRQFESGPDGPGPDLLRVHTHLTSPELLYGPQEARTRLFGLLIGISTLAALVGFTSARRAFHRQQRLSEMKSNFVSSVSHELRAPIASVRLMAESLERGTIQDPARQKDYFRFIVQESRRLGTLIENVLDFARIEQGRKQYDPAPTDIAALIRHTVQVLSPAATEKQVTLTLDLPASPRDLEPPPVLDGQAIQQALVNLIDNAVKHSPPGSEVQVGVPPRPENAGTLQIFVEDHGPGIPPEDHARIFERFYRRGSELRRDTPGVGIGLSIVQHIAEAHGGRVTVRSAPGQGSRFTLEFPWQPTEPTDPTTDPSRP